MSEEPQNTMQGRARRRASPAGIRTRPARVEPEPPPPTKRHELRATRVAVVYYLCRNQQLEHPHFMEVPLASPQGLYLRDVISRLDALRGKGMAAKYSWSCKRRYKNGFVWHDLSEGDLLLPAQGTEYVLKGSEALSSNSTSQHQITSRIVLVQAVQRFSFPSQLDNKSRLPLLLFQPCMKAKVPPPTRRQALSSSASSDDSIGYDEQCRMPHSGSSSGSSPKTISTPSSGASSPGLNNPAAAHDAATQTDEEARGGDNAKLQQRQHALVATPESSEIVDEPCPKHRPAGECSSSRKSGTLQSMIRAEAAGRRRSLLLQEEDERSAATGFVGGRLKPASLLMRLMACGRHNPSFGLVHQTSCKPRFTRRLEFPSSPELKPGTDGASTVRASETENSTGSTSKRMSDEKYTRFEGSVVPL